MAGQSAAKPNFFSAIDHDFNNKQFSSFYNNTVIQGGIDGEVFWRAMLNHDEEGAGCQHRETMPQGIELFTHVAYYYLPAEKRTLRRAIARDKGRVLYPCEVPTVEIRA